MGLPHAFDPERPRRVTRSQSIPIFAGVVVLGFGCFGSGFVMVVAVLTILA